MHTWCSPGRVKYGSRAPSRSAIQSRAGLFQSVSIFARETAITHYNTLQHTTPHFVLMSGHSGSSFNLDARTLLQHTATHCNTLQHTATHYSTLQHHWFQWAVTLYKLSIKLWGPVCDTLYHTVTHYNTLKPCNISWSNEYRGPAYSNTAISPKDQLERFPPRLESHGLCFVAMRLKAMQKDARKGVEFQ